MDRAGKVKPGFSLRGAEDTEENQSRKGKAGEFSLRMNPRRLVLLFVLYGSA